MKRKINRERIFTALIAVLVLGLLAVWVGDGLCRLFRKPSEVTCIDERGAETESETEQNSEFTDFKKEEELPVKEASLGLTGLPAGYTTERKSVESLSEGTLAYSDTLPLAKNLVDFEDKNEYYHLKNMKLKIQESAVTAMNLLAETRFQETGRSDLIVYSTSELYEKAGSVYPDFLPDRNTGFGLDLAFLNEDGTISGMTEEPDTWLHENCWRFGFVFSVPEKPYHIRYVGNIHAAIMQKENLTLAEYLHALRAYSVSVPYTCVYEKEQMIIYFVPAAAFGYTDVPVPEYGSCQISGNGTDGYIVTAVVGHE